MTQMSNKGNRASLKRIFSRGETPTQEDFYLLIDACLNLNDDPISCTPNGGLKVQSNEKDGTLLEFQIDPNDNAQNWLLLRQNDPLGQPGLSLRFKPYRESNIQRPPYDPLFVGEGGHVGISHNNPRYALEVGGTVGMETRLGTFLEGQVASDGRWNNILGGLSQPVPRGYFALEVLAYIVAPAQSGRYGITHAVCMGAYPQGNKGFWEWLGFQNRKGIQITQAYFENKRHRIDIRWGGSQEAPTLELRTSKRLVDCKIHFRVTNLMPNLSGSHTQNGTGTSTTAQGAAPTQR